MFINIFYIYKYMYSIGLRIEYLYVTKKDLAYYQIPQSSRSFTRLAMK